MLRSKTRYGGKATPARVEGWQTFELVHARGDGEGWIAVRTDAIDSISPCGRNLSEIAVGQRVIRVVGSAGELLAQVQRRAEVRGLGRARVVADAVVSALRAGGWK